MFVRWTNRAYAFSLKVRLQLELIGASYSETRFFNKSAIARHWRERATFGRTLYGLRRTHTTLLYYASWIVCLQLSSTQAGKLRLSCWAVARRIKRVSKYPSSSCTVSYVLLKFQLHRIPIISFGKYLSRIWMRYTHTGCG